MRKRLFEIIEAARADDRASRVYDILMILTIMAGLLPLAFKEETAPMYWLDRVSLVIFIIDYFLRWMTADYKFGKHSIDSFLRYPFSPMAVVDLVSILPSLRIISRSFKLLRVLRLIRAFRVFRVFKMVRYSRSVRVVLAAFRRARTTLIAVATLACAYILLAALLIFNVEPDSFDTFFDAVYWSTVSLTTVGYGDIYPVTSLGRLVTMISSFVGIAVVALPSSVVTASYLREVGASRDLED